MAGFRTPVLRGRDAQLAILGEELDRVRGGTGALVLVEGGAGTGKSRLLDEAVAIAHQLSFGADAGAAEAGDGAVQLAPLMAALFDWPPVAFGDGSSWTFRTRCDCCGELYAG
jgi:hypothetical protein